MLITTIFLFLLIGTLFYGGYKLRKNREKASDDTILVETEHHGAIMLEKHEAATFVMNEKIRRDVKRNRAAYKKMKPRKFQLGSYKR